jgi:hypothetical protein
LTLAASEASRQLAYCQNTGAFTWRVNAGGRALAGMPAGTVIRGADKVSYRMIKVAGKKYMAHRLAWLIVTGEWPPALVDHKDGDGTNNAWTNLRLASHSQNLMNRGATKANKCGLKGVSYDARRDKWFARIKANNQVVWLGYFPSKEEAHAAYARAATHMHGQYARAA